MRNFINMVESISQNPDVNANIDQRLEILPKDLQSIVLDALDQIMISGDEGLSGGHLLGLLRKLNPDIDDAGCKAVLKEIVNNFKFCVSLVGNQFTWKEKEAVEHDDDIDPALHAMASQQIAITSSILDEMNRRGEFTEEEILPIIMGHGMSLDMARMFFDHTISTMVGKTLRSENGKYRLIKTEPKTMADHMQAFRDMTDISQK